MDIDIDVSDNKSVRLLFPKAIRATIIEADEFTPHQVGLYFQNIPVDMISGTAAIPYEEAENIGYQKIDILNLKLLESFSSKEELREMLDQEPDWNLLCDKDTVKKLFHLSKHYDVLRKIRPKNVEELADTLALIRPNKVGLIDKYRNNQKEVRKLLYVKNDPSDLRKSHAIPYALLIVLQLHLIEQGKL